MAIVFADTAWVLISSALVLFMIPGLALFYGGMVRRKNVLSSMMHSFVVMGIVAVLWVVVSNSHFENSLGHQPPETAKKDKIAIVFLKKYVTFVSYIIVSYITLVTCIMY